MVKYYELINWYVNYDKEGDKELLNGDYKPSMLRDSENNYQINYKGVYRFLGQGEIKKKKSKKVSDDSKNPYGVTISKQKKGKDEIEYYVQITSKREHKTKDKDGNKITVMKDFNVIFKLKNMDRYFKNNQKKKIDNFLKSFAT